MDQFIMMQWYAIQSKTQKEDLLCEQLRLREIEIFFPQIRVDPINPRARKIKPYFPGYVFGYVDLEQVGRSFLEWIPGAVGVVNFGGEPAPVADHLIATLRQHLEMINALTVKRSMGFQAGDMVEIRWGPFADYEAVFDACLPGRDRVKVLLNMLENYQIPVELPIAQIGLKQTASALVVGMN
jgi:transcription antitermination factor NusG